MRVVKQVAPPTGLSRLLFRLPLGLYRIGLGWLLGGRFMLLTHVGRVSGNRRETVIEVVHRSDDGSCVAASGFGARADWYRNILRTPEVTIQIGRRVMPVTAVPLDTDEGADVMGRYAMRHPRLARRLCRLMGFEVDGSEADFREVGRRIPFVRFAPRC